MNNHEYYTAAIKQPSDGQPRRLDAASGSARDWTDDLAHENGNYWNECLLCRKMFIGYKRRLVCKACDAEWQAVWKTMTDEERAIHNSAVVELLAHMRGQNDESSHPAESK